MGRQQTLGRSLIFLPHKRTKSYALIVYPLAKFFEMPKNAKPAPPQQSSLLEMWKGGKRKGTGAPKEQTDGDTTKLNIKGKQKDEDAMDVDSEEQAKREETEQEKPGAP